ncbi:MAG: polysaccharide deacetylase family protein [Cytophagales bacterium]|nr:polysaccharide deacetylase family protein [Bernardetiaceae bacterium]MDW8204799.1 polysaccharide deacetylase family protein [Cytophagales bacterium]
MTDRKVLAITFDDGPDSLCTQQVLAILAKENIKATFYVTVDSVIKWGKILERMVAAGHSIGMRGQSHRNLR